MSISKFISVGENIHCTRIYKVDGKYARKNDAGEYSIFYEADGKDCMLPVPNSFQEQKTWQDGKVKHCAVAIWQALNGDDVGRPAGMHYIQSLAKAQEAAGATYLDINVDEFSTDVEERMQLMKWTVETVQKAVSIPVSIDSSNTDILKAGLESCDKDRGRPMVNSVSLERMSAIDIAKGANAVVIASAAGEKDLPSSNEERMANFEKLVTVLKERGFEDSDLHLDPLVLPVSVDSNNARLFLESVTMVREKYGPDVHIVAGLSNVSFGMPARKLINQVFTHLACEAGGDGGIVDPLQINIDVLNSIDIDSEGYQMARALLMGEDEFGMNFIMAAREGKL